MTTGLLITLAGQQAIAKHLAGAAPLVITAVAWGDARGDAYAPNENQVELVRERYRANIAMVAVIDGAIVVDAIIPDNTPDAQGRPSYGFTVSEVGLYGTSGDVLTLLGVAALSDGYLPNPATGVTRSAAYRLKLPVANPSAITVVIDPQAQLALGREVRPQWLTVDGVVNAPPAGPAVGATYVIGDAPTGAWAGFAGRLAQWIGVWSLASAPEGHRVNDRSKAEDHPLRELKYIGGAWVSAAATSTAYGVTRLASADEAEAGVADDVALTPKRQRATMIIDAAVAYTVYGPGADFVDLNAADRWLSYRRITKTGFVTLSLAAGKWINTQTQTLSHPNGDRIEIVGGAMVGQFPAYGDLTLTGSSAAQRAADTLANLALCRARWATELRFTGGAMLGFATAIGRLARVLVTCDGSPADGLYVVGNQRLEQVAVTGAGRRGLASVSGSQVYDRVLSFGNGQHGILAGDAGQISVVTAAIAVSNGDSGLRAEAAVLRQATGVIYGSCNAGSGVLAADGGRIIAGAGSYANLNASYGWIAQSGGYIGADASVANGNLGGPYYATGASRIAAVGATASGGTSVAYDNSSIRATGAAIGTLSPAANTVGNYNSYITV